MGGCAFQRAGDWGAAREMWATPEAEVEALRNEIVKLRNELAEANEERAQAAEYGLAVLEEKQNIQQQYEDLTSLYESTQRELEVTVSVSSGVAGCSRFVALCGSNDVGRRSQQPVLASLLSSHRTGFAYDVTRPEALRGVREVCGQGEGEV